MPSLADPTPTSEGDDLEALEKLARSATPRPWKQRSERFDDWGWIRSSEGDLVAIARAGHVEADLYEHRAKGTDPYEHNAAYIVAACNAAPHLIARIRELEAARTTSAAPGDLREVAKGGGGQADVAGLAELFDEIGDAIAEIEVAAVHAGNEPEARGAKKALGAVAKIRSAALAAAPVTGDRS